MDPRDIAARERGKRWQVLELMYELCGGRPRFPIRNLIEEAQRRLRLEERELLQHVVYWHCKGCATETVAHFNALSVHGVDTYEAAVLGAATRTGSMQPLLRLEALEKGNWHTGRAAVIVGHGRFADLRREVGAAQLLFLQALFASKQSTVIDNLEMTYVREADLIPVLLGWHRVGLRRLDGPDKKRPAARIQKDWKSFLYRMSLTPALKGMFVAPTLPRANLGKVYGILLAPHEIMTTITNVEDLFKK